MGFSLQYLWDSFFFHDRFSWPLMDLRNGSITEMKFQRGDFNLINLNSTSHLEHKEGDKYAL